MEYFSQETTIIPGDRIKPLNQKALKKGEYVIYWMQASQRSECNHALEFAILLANSVSLPLIVYFGLTENFPEANARHYYFMLQGLREVQSALNNRCILFIIRKESPEKGVLHLANNAAAVITDRGYLRIQRDWRREIAANIDCLLLQVETDTLIPVEEVSKKEEYSAATIRPKINKLLPRYLKPIEEQDLKNKSTGMDFYSLNLNNIPALISSLNIDQRVLPVNTFQGGTSQAKNRLTEFLNKKLAAYPEERNDPNSDSLSNLSPYLHFGQISPLYIALRTMESHLTAGDVFLEELTIRRELAINYTHYNHYYDSFEGLQDWCKKTFLKHLYDPREYNYDLSQLENATTHDKYWNATQREMVTAGKMHGYMRMYWGKKIIEWTATPQAAYKAALYLNNKYELDGRDPNGFAGVAWCFGKHDRPWMERPVFGNVRFMNSSGLKRKFDADRYADKYSPDK
jgi:deoxyribodipyrimidine photo-lyase